MNREGIFRCIGRNKLLPGDILIYYLIAKRNIKEGDEIMWYYGKGYERDYKVGKKN